MDKRHKQRFAAGGAAIAGGIIYHLSSAALTGSSLLGDMVQAAAGAAEAGTGGMIPASVAAPVLTLMGLATLGVGGYRMARDVQLGHFKERIVKKKEQLFGKGEEREVEEKEPGKLNKLFKKVKSLSEQIKSKKKENIPGREDQETTLDTRQGENSQIEHTSETQEPSAKPSESWFDRMVVVEKGKKKIPGVKKPENEDDKHKYSSHDITGFFGALVHRRKGSSQEHHK